MIISSSSLLFKVVSYCGLLCLIRKMVVIPISIDLYTLLPVISLFVSNSIGSSTIHPIYLSLPIIIPYYTKVNTNKTSLIAFKMEGIIGFPEKVTKIHRPFCEGYYSLSQHIPIPINQRISYSISPFLNDYGYHFSLTSQDVFDFDKNDRVLHISAEESITNQKHQFLSQQDILTCSTFMLSMQFRNSDDPSVVSSFIHCLSR